MKKIIRLFLLFLVIINVKVVNAIEFDISADNVILYNLNDNKVLYELESEKSVNVASLTKIMTAIVAIENIEDLNKEVVVTKNAFNGISEYSKMGLQVGNVVTYRDLLYGILLPSGADAVNVMALNLSGSISSFVDLMNNKVTELGLSGTHFDNPIGMDSENNYSTAKDVSKILLYALENETFKEIFYTREYIVPSLNKTIKSTLIGYSKNMGLDVDNITGAKSGFTDGAGLCLASVANYDDVEYLLVVMGSDINNRGNAVKDTLEIYEYYSGNYSYRKIVTKDDVVKKLDVKFGKEDTYEIKNKDDVYLYLENSLRRNRIKYIYEGIEELNYLIKKGTKLGTVRVEYEGELLTSYDVYLDEELDYYHPGVYALIVLLFLIMVISFSKIRRNKTKKRRKRRKSRR